MKLIALEIGSSAVKIGVAEFDPTAGENAPVTLLAVEEEPIPTGVRFGRIQNVEDVKATVSAALNRLKNHPSLANTEISGVYTSIGGRSLSTISTRKALALPDEMLIDAPIVDRLKNEALEAVPAGRDVLDVMALDYTVDGLSSKRPIGSYCRNLSARFTIVVCDPLNSRNIERVLFERLNLEICGYVVRPLAIAQASLTIEDLSAGVMLVDMGAETTTISIYYRGDLVYIATLPLGSRNITRDLAIGLAVPEERAEDLKKRFGNALPESPITNDEQKEIDNYVQARATEIVDNIIAYIEFAGLKPEDLRGGIIVTGRGAKLRNLCTLLSRQSQLPVRMAMPPAQVKIADPAINPADNLDLIAVALRAAQMAAQPDALQCLVEKEPVVVTKEEPIVNEEPQQAEQTIDNDPYDDNPYESDNRGGFYVDNDKEPLYEDEPRYNPDDDDPDLLYDEDEARKRRKKRAEKQNQREKNPGGLSRWMSRIGNRIGDIIRDETEGGDLD